MDTTKTIKTQDSIARQLHGTAFLSLEHWTYMLLVVVVPAFLLAGFKAALGIWSNRASEMSPLLIPAFGNMHTNVAMAISIAAALLVLAPLMYVLRRRSQIEMTKRQGYQKRMAYKLPIYGALAILAFFKIVAAIMVVSAFLSSFTLIGVKEADMSAIYMGQFLPALLALLVFGLTSWYVINLAKGRNYSSQFTLATLWLSALLIVTLFTTAVMATQNQNQGTDRTPPVQTYPWRDKNYNYWME